MNWSNLFKLKFKTPISLLAKGYGLIYLIFDIQKGSSTVGQRLAQISILLTGCLLLAACSSSRDRPSPEMCALNPMCTVAPKKATSRPYQIKGEWHHPQPHYEYDEVGVASYYGGRDIFHGRPTATGEIFDMNEVTAAHKTLPLPCIVEVTNLDNGRQIQLKVNDRGPFVEGRIIDVSQRTAQLLGFHGKGTAKVRVRSLVPESLALNGLDSSQVMLAQASPIPATMASSSEAGMPVAMAQLPRLPDTLFEEQGETTMLAEASLPSNISEVPASTGIFLHVGGYENYREAHALLNSLASVTNSPAQPVKNKGPKPHAVQLGPLASMSHANEIVDLLLKEGHDSRIVLQR